jgi:hypothetical protein
VNVLNKHLQAAFMDLSTSLGTGRGTKTASCKGQAGYKMLRKDTNLDGLIATTNSVKNGSEIWNLECLESL